MKFILFLKEQVVLFLRMCFPDDETEALFLSAKM